MRRPRCERRARSCQISSNSAELAQVDGHRRLVSRLITARLNPADDARSTAERGHARLGVARPIEHRYDLLLGARIGDHTPIFLARWQAIRAGAPLSATADGPSLLELCRELAYRMLSHCNFCPWNCRVDRAAGTKLGACKLASASRVSSHFHHTGEELFYRGTEGSGTIFFTSCNMRCAFCQNGDISTDKDNGEKTDPRTLAAMAWTLRREGCHNINWVGGEVVIHLHAIVHAIALLGRDFAPTQAELRRARQTKADRFFWFDEVPDKAVYEGKFNAPMLWNSNFFMTIESMKILRVLTDVWLPDFKFGPGRCAMTLAKTPWYWETVTRNLALIVE